MPSVTESADASPTDGSSGEVFAEYRIADIVSITETAERHGALRALQLTRAAALHRWSDSRPDLSDAVEVAVRRVAKDLDIEL